MNAPHAISARSSCLATGNDLRSGENGEQPAGRLPLLQNGRGLWNGNIAKFKYKEFSSGLPLSVVRSIRQRPREIHRHDFSEIVVVTRGVGMHVSEYAAWPVQAGDVFVIGGRQAHYYDDVHDLDLVNVLFQRDRIKLDVHDIAELPGFQALFGIPDMRSRQEFRSRFRLQARDLALVQAYIDALERELAAPNPAKACFSNAYFMLILGSLSRLYSRQGNFDSSAVLSIAKVITHIEKNFSEPLSLSALARVAGMTERSLLRTFHRATGDSPHNYLIKVRINRAAAELQRPEKQITEIAFEVGFNDSNYFTRQFKQHMGITPLEYRREIMDGSQAFSTNKAGVFLPVGWKPESN